MSDRRFEVIFRGDVVPGQSLMDVKRRLAELFGAPAAKVEQMFSGRPVVIKRDLDEEAAARYRVALNEAGALVELRPVEPDSQTGSDISRPDQTVPPAASGPEPSKAAETIDVAPVGADVLPPEYRRDFTPREVDTSYITVDEPGADVLKADEKSPAIERNVDTSHLSVKDHE